MSTAFPLAWFAKTIDSKTIKGIAQKTAALVRSGTLPPGTRLPTIRVVAKEMGVSPAIITQAWSELRRQEILIGRGKTGTWVNEQKLALKPERLTSSGRYAHGVLDLAIAAPDPKLLPSLRDALAHGASVSIQGIAEKGQIAPELRERVQASWPYDAEAFLAASGSYHAILTILHSVVKRGSVVAIEDPTAMRLLSALEELDARVIAMPCDEFGLTPTSVAKAMKYRPTAFVFQPRLHSVTGQTLSAARMGEIGDVLAKTNALVIEHDGLGDLSSAPRQSLGRRFPDRTIHIFSYSKTLGPDLRVGVVSSSGAIIRKLQSEIAFSAGWPSSILQNAVAFLLREGSTQQIVEHARSVYHQRRERFRTALRERGITTLAGSGLAVWLPVEEEQFAMVTLAARNIAVTPGRKFSVHQINSIRVACSMLEERTEEVADAVALARCRGS